MARKTEIIFKNKIQFDNSVTLMEIQFRRTAVNSMLVWLAMIEKHAKSNHGENDAGRYTDRTGKLTRSIGVVKTKPKVEVKGNQIIGNSEVGAEYSAYVENTHPYMRPAAKAKEQPGKNLMEKNLSKVTRKQL